MEIVRCHVVDGIAYYEGGGIFNQGNLSLDSCNISGNIANFNGGGISNSYGTSTSQVEK
jgi:hypothetical protein